MPVARTMPLLAKAGKIKEGDVIEVMPVFLPPDSAKKDKRFRAQVRKVEGGKDSVKWEEDDRLYSPSNLLDIIINRFSIGYTDKTFRNWRREGQPLSMWDEAEYLLHPGEKHVDPPPRRQTVKKICWVVVKTFFVAIISSLGAKFGGWLFGVIVAACAGALAVTLPFGPAAGTSDHAE